MKIGILGGTFDPIHEAHLELGRQAMERYDLDQIMVMPSGNSYFKTRSKQVTDAHYRAEMVKLAIRHREGFVFSDYELQRQGYTYTSDTLLQLTRLYPDVEWYFIIGADSLHTMGTWYAPEVIFRYATILVANRNDQVPVEQLKEDRRALVDRYNARIRLMYSKTMEVSSTKLRESLANGSALEETMNTDVLAYIHKHHLYQRPLTKDEILQDLQKRIKGSRYQHTLGVAQTARAMAEHYGTVEPDRAELAGIIHDCGKYEGTALTHGSIGARIARWEYGITDEEILSAVICHTTGHPAMTDLEKILFIADYIEPGREKAPRLEELRRIAYEDMDLAVQMILEDTIAYLNAIHAVIDSASFQTYDYYKRKVAIPKDIVTE